MKPKFNPGRKSAWICFDLDNGDACGGTYAWVFDARKKARDFHARCHAEIAAGLFRARVSRPAQYRRIP